MKDQIICDAEEVVADLQVYNSDSSVCILFTPPFELSYYGEFKYYLRDSVMV